MDVTDMPGRRVHSLQASTTSKPSHSPPAPMSCIVGPSHLATLAFKCPCIQYPCTGQGLRPLHRTLANLVQGLQTKFQQTIVFAVAALDTILTVATTVFLLVLSVTLGATFSLFSCGLEQF